MKRKKKNAENPLPSVCPVCGMDYDDLKTGYTFKGVRDLMWRSSDDPARWRYKRRHGVLGLWAEIKRGLWKDHIAICEGAEEEAKKKKKTKGKAQKEVDTSFDPSEFDPDFKKLSDDDFEEF